MSLTLWLDDGMLSWVGGREGERGGGERRGRGVKGNGVHLPLLSPLARLASWVAGTSGPLFVCLFGWLTD